MPAVSVVGTADEGAEDAAAERQEQAAPDAVLTRIGQVASLHHAGDPRGGPAPLPRPVGGDRRGRRTALHRCTLAHYLAAAQDDPLDQLAWDLGR
ncbi:hypothetical protein SALBM311S_02957 [Streptomyces alboniger]